VQSAWVQEEISLSEYLGQNVRFRFQLRADGGTRKDGFYFDDFKIFYNLQAPPQAPVAAFQVTNTTVCVGSTVQFTDYSSNIPTSWDWSFGDGGNAAQPNPTHIFNATGTYTVSLTVANSTGSLTKIKSNLIRVFDSPGQMQVLTEGFESWPNADMWAVYNQYGDPGFNMTTTASASGDQCTQ
jgi:PKD repeat protein